MRDCVFGGGLNSTVGAVVMISGAILDRQSMPRKDKGDRGTKDKQSM